MSWVVAADIAARIKDLRRVLSRKPNRALPQEDLGIRAGVRPSQVSQWERGVQHPSRSRLERWAEREGWPVEIFAEGGRRPSEVLTPTANGKAPEGAGASGSGGSLDPEEILARFYRLMAEAAEEGNPWPPELAQLMDEMYRAAKAAAAAPTERGPGPTEIPGW